MAEESAKKLKNIKPVAVAVIVVAAGAGIYWWHNSTVRRIKNEALITQQGLYRQIKELQAEIARLKGAPDTSHLFKVYGADAATMQPTIEFYVPIPETLSLLEKLKILTDKLSACRFSYLPVNVLRIKNYQGRKVAVIDLRERGPSYPASWRTHYFQGSAGGAHTTLTLTRTLLQEDYQGEWIDGLEFYYEGKPISEADWDHISLSGTIWRKN
jgi:hypothetical protein